MAEDKGVLVPVYLRKRGQEELRQLRQKYIQRQDPGIAIVSGGPYFRREYTTVGGLNDFKDYLGAFGLPSNVVIGDGFNDTTSSIILDTIIDFLKSNEIDPNPLRIRFECYESLMRNTLKDRFDTFVKEYNDAAASK
jgi:hypothetical protein